MMKMTVEELMNILKEHDKNDTVMLRWGYVDGNIKVCLEVMPKEEEKCGMGWYSVMEG